MIKTNHSFSAEIRDGVLYVALEGEIDHHSAVSVRGEIDRLIYQTRPSRFELELSRIGFMDSSGLGLVMGRYALLRDLGGEMAVIDPSPAILRIFKLAGMERLIRIEWSRERESVETENQEKGREEDEKKERDSE